MDDNTLRAVIVAGLTPIVGASVRFLWTSFLRRVDPNREARQAAKRARQLDRAYRFGRRVAHRLRQTH